MEFALTSQVLADILDGRRGWPTEQEFAMSDRQRTDPKIIGTPATPATARVLGNATPVQAAAPPELKQEELDDGRVLQVAETPTRADLPGEMHTPAADVHETTDDGRTIQIASKGVPIPIAQARQLGLVKDTQTVRHETKDA